LLGGVTLLTRFLVLSPDGKSLSSQVETQKPLRFHNGNRSADDPYPLRPSHRKMIHPPMNRLFKRGLLAATAVAVPAGALLAGPLAANAAPSTITAVTHSSNHEDTTTATTSYQDPTYGYVWAYDNLSIKLSASPIGTNTSTYTVNVTTHGSFNEFADPTTGQPSTGSGSVDGTISYTVTSSTPPDAKYLPSQEPGAHLGQIVNDLFDGNTSSIVSGPYSFSYTPIDGGVYTQNG
jgi:hypothetical protein